MNIFIFLAIAAMSSSTTDEPKFAAEQIFAPVQEQTHAPGIVECANGDLIASCSAPENAGANPHGAHHSSWRIGPLSLTATPP
jgi:hypothetical protein